MEIVTIAQRKAAKKANLMISEQNTGSTTNVGASLPNITVEGAIKAHSAISTNNSEVIETSRTQENISNGAGAMRANAQPIMTSQEILELAAKHGLKLQAPKKEFVKHTYSVTTESKALFKKYCDVLGINMQDAMEEALQNFFKKHALEYTRVKEAKNA